MKKIFFLCICMIFMLVAIPYSITSALKELNIEEKFTEDGYSDEIQSDIPSEEYIIGVVAAEMPALYEMDALKAQAVASRTYAYKHGLSGQEFIDIEQMQEKWGESFDMYYKKISQAVKETEGEIIFYDGELVEAVFHSMSAGVTQNAENVWQKELPYLKSVDSSLDKNADGYLTEKAFTEEELKNIFSDYYKKVYFKDSNFLDSFKILEQNESEYISSVEVEGIQIDAEELRKILGLRSVCFSVTKIDDEIIFTTKGYGHGVGMSQTGANLMAKQGYEYKDILKHYYQGVDVIVNPI